MPTATKLGVSITPCGVWMRPTRARDLVDVWSSSNLKLVIWSILNYALRKFNAWCIENDDDHLNTVTDDNNAAY